MMANAPLSGRDGESLELIWVSREAEYFLEWGWTRGSTNCLSGKSLEDYTEPCSPEIGRCSGRGTFPPADQDEKCLLLERKLTSL
jgi:hypothetical protein